MKFRIIFLSLSIFSLLAGCAQSIQPVSGEFKAGTGIIGGEDVEPGSRIGRSVVALFGRGAGLCSGTLISQNAILTAAHCVPRQPGIRLYVLFGTSFKGVSTRNIRPVVKMFAHPKWGVPKTATNWGDIAVMKFSGSVPPGFFPAPFLGVPNLIASHTSIILSGFGVSDSMSQEGAGVLRDTFATITNPHFSATEVSVDQRDGKGSCSGDSGGPAFIRYNGNIYLWGVVSRGDPQCLKNGIYTNALFYRPWIKEILQLP